MASKVSKNARSGAKQVQRVTLCSSMPAHVMTNVFIVGVGMRLLCPCYGYAPIDATRPYAQIKAPEAQGKACLPRKAK